jgi:hypothetical protein
MRTDESISTWVRGNLIFVNSQYEIQIENRFKNQFPFKNHPTLVPTLKYEFNNVIRKFFDLVKRKKKNGHAK